MASYNSSQSDGRQWNQSPRPKGRENTKNILCRNVTIYGYCRHEKDGCTYNHDTTKAGNTSNMADSNLAKRLNVDSPSFTPSHNDTNASKPNTISPKAASAAPFTPKSSKAEIQVNQNARLATPPASTRNHSAEWPPGNVIPEFVPQTYNPGLQNESNPLGPTVDPFNPYSTPANAYGGMESGQPGQPPNPYAHDSGGPGGHSFFPQSGGYAPPLQHHLYAPMGPHRENLLAYQRTAHDFFISESLRSDLQRKSEATMQVLPNSKLPTLIEHFHTLVPLDTNNQKSNTAFGYNSWVYKAVSSKDGNVYVLRRLEGFRLTNEKAVRPIQAWKRVSNPGVVTVHDCFTTRAFGDSSLVFVTDYHPVSKTLAEQHHIQTNFQRNRPSTSVIPEQVLWGYIVELGSALKTIHSNGLAARLISSSKILVTNKNRIRLNACGILDVVQANDPTPIQNLQQEDLRQLGRLVLTLASNGPSVMNNQRPFEMIARSYSERFRNTLRLLIEGPGNQAMEPPFDINTFLGNIADQVVTSFDNSLHHDDQINTELAKELENARLVRLLSKLGFVNERPEYSEHAHANAQWAETGERYYLKLFRDFVFHQVNAEGKPVVDLGHVVTCLNKLDAGSEEKITLVTRDEQNIFIVSYKEIKLGLERAFQDLLKAGRRM